jgi:hypothetical protein
MWLATYAEAFTFWDDDIFFAPLRGEPQNYVAPIWPDSGRFFPLAHQEFTFLAPLDSSGFFYRIFAGLELGLVGASILILFREKIWLGGLLTAAIFLTPAISTSFMGLIFSERNQIVLIAAMMVFGTSYLRRPGPLALFGLTAPAVPLVLYKEIAFIFPATLGGTLLLAAVAPKLFAGRALGNRHLLLAAVPLLFTVTLFLAYYALAIYPRVITSYAAERAQGYGASFTAIANQPWSWVLAVALAGRLWVISKGLRLHPMWDGMAAAAFGYAAAVVVLQFIWPYYVAPSGFVAWTYAGWVALQMHGRGRALVVCAIALCLAFQMPTTWSDFRVRKELVASKDQAARFIAAYAKMQGLGSKRQPIYVNVMASDRYEAGLFGNYIKARYHVSVVMAIPSGPAPPTGIAPCNGGGDVLCDYHHEPQPGDLSVSFVPWSPVTAPGGQELELIYTTEPVGFWRNTLNVRIFRVR